MATMSSLSSKFPLKLFSQNACKTSTEDHLTLSQAQEGLEDYGQFYLCTGFC